ncbi:HAD family phosphatase [Pollutibacter soli]|uniref:HAD family hydrolase n=1 Tax=Pollutibacter soli TaxID=3034157 RepID=UPI0030133FD5
MNIKTIVFDLGAVLIDWHPEHLYKNVIEDEKERKWFLENICTSDWNEEQDAGRPLAVATEELVQKFPSHENSIRAYYGRWIEMLNGPIHGTVDIFKELKAKGKYKFYALTNWSAETFPIALEKFEFLQWFDGVLVSGEEKMRKPTHQFYQKLFDKFSFDPKYAVFIDDNKRNLVPAKELGMYAIHFTNPEDLRAELVKINVL